MTAGRIRTTGAKPVQIDLQDRYRMAWAEDAAITRARIERETQRGGHGASSNSSVNETQRLKNASLTVERRAKRQCSSCGKMRLPDDLIAPVQRGHYGSRVCADSPVCLEKAKRWARTSD